MNELTKWGWLIFILFLWLGGYVLAVLAGYAVIIGLLAWLKPEWLEEENFDKIGRVFAIIVISLIVVFSLIAWLMPEWVKSILGY